MRWIWPIAVAVLLGIAPPAAGQQVPILDGSVREGTLSFDGHASVGDFTGVTTTVTGELRGAPHLAEVQGWVDAPVNTLKTGKDRRDRDLNKSMESETYPQLRFELTQVEAGTGSTDSLPATLHGRLILHGISQDVALPATLSFGEDGVRVRTSFPLNLKDYQIGGLSKMLGVLKMDEHIVVHVDVRFRFTR
jgi:polyisoprenoid-binding protein YceI